MRRPAAGAGAGVSSARRSGRMPAYHHQLHAPRFGYHAVLFRVQLSVPAVVRTSAMTPLRDAATEGDREAGSTGSSGCRRRASPSSRSHPTAPLHIARVHEINSLTPSFTLSEVPPGAGGDHGKAVGHGLVVTSDDPSSAWDGETRRNLRREHAGLLTHATGELDVVLISPVAAGGRREVPLPAAASQSGGDGVARRKALSESPKPPASSRLHRDEQRAASTSTAGPEGEWGASGVRARAPETTPLGITRTFEDRLRGHGHPARGPSVAMTNRQAPPLPESRFSRLEGLEASHGVFHAPAGSRTRGLSAVS